MTRMILSATLLLLAAACNKTKEEEQEVSAEDVARQLAAVKVDPGQWDTSTQIVSATGPLPQEALQQMVGQKTEVSHCITPEEAARPSANFLAAQQGSDCTYQNFQMAGGKVKGRMTCSGGQMPGRVVTDMSGAYGSQAYDMIMDMETPGLPGGGAIRIKARTQGKRVGECSSPDTR